MVMTTIAVKETDKKRLEKFKKHPRATHSEVFKDVLDLAESEK